MPWALHNVDPVLAGGDAVLRLQFVGDEPVAESGIVGVDLQDRVNQVRVGPVPGTDRACSPLVVGLRREAEHPAGHRHGDPVCGKLADQRVYHFGLTPCPR